QIPMSSHRFLLCLLLSSIVVSSVEAKATMRQKRDVVKPIVGAVGGPLDGALGTVGDVYGQIPALAWLEAVIKGISATQILEANGKTVDSIVNPVLGTIVKPADKREKRDVDALLGTVGDMYGQFPALAWIQALLQGVSVTDILEANGATIDSIVNPVLGTIVKPKGTGAPAATTAPSA
ncbi:hypothetical protein PMAYCL1PPCAC_04735, partial [Pristionchus mayeri]